MSDIEWKDDGFFIHVKTRDYATGEFFWKRAGPAEFKAVLASAIAAEREQCAKVADKCRDNMGGEWDSACSAIADNIRGRG